MPTIELSVGDIAELVLALSTTVSLIYISSQVTVTRRQTKGEFLLALDEQLDKSRDMLMRVVSEPDFKPTGQEWPRVWTLMNVFERISIMVEDGIIDIGIVDRLHGYVMLKLIANEAIFQRVKETGADWQDFVELCYQLAKRRQRSGHPHDKAFVERVRQLSKDARSMNPFAM